MSNKSTIASIIAAIPDIADLDVEAIEGL